MLGVWEVDIWARKLLYGVEHVEKISRFYLEHNTPFSWDAIVEISSAGYAPEAIFSQAYLVDKTRYFSALCSLQY